MPEMNNPEEMAAMAEVARLQERLENLREHTIAEVCLHPLKHLSFNVIEDEGERIVQVTCGQCHSVRDFDA